MVFYVKVPVCHVKHVQKENNQGLQMQDKQLLQRPALISCERLILKWSFLQENGGLLDDMLWLGSWKFGRFKDAKTEQQVILGVLIRRAGSGLFMIYVT